MTAPRDTNFGWPAAMRDGTACRYLDVSRSTFWRWVDEDRLSKGRMVNGVRLWSRQELDSFLARLFDQAGIAYNHATGIDRLTPTTGVRADIIWTEADQAAFIDGPSPHLAEAWLAALYTLARESDLCDFRWEQFDGRWLVYKPSKTAHSTAPTVHLPVYRLEPLKALLERLPRDSAYILTAQSGVPWTTQNLSRQFDRRRKLLKLDHLRWHDIRGTGITRLYNAGCTDAEVASISGHVMGAGAQQRSYIARTRELAEHAFDKWDRAMLASGTVIPFPPRNGQ